MELKDFKEKLEQKQKGMNIALSSAQRAFLYGSYYEITGRTANINCSSCDSYTYKILLNYLKIQEPTDKQFKNNTLRSLISKYRTDTKMMLNG